MSGTIHFALCIYQDLTFTKIRRDRDVSATLLRLNIYILDIRNFSRLCRYNLLDCLLMERYVMPASKHSNRQSEKIARFYHKVMGCLGEANGRNCAPKEAFIMDHGALEDQNGDSRSWDLALLSSGYYRDPKTLLRRLDYYEKEACRLEAIGQCQAGQYQAAQCLRLNCLELAEFGGEMFYSSQESDDDMTDKEEMTQFLDRIMSMAILCATSSLDIGNIEMIACVHTKVKGDFSCAGWTTKQELRDRRERVVACARRRDSFRSEVKAMKAAISKKWSYELHIYSPTQQNCTCRILVHTVVCDSCIQAFTGSDGQYHAFYTHGARFTTSSHLEENKTILHHSFSFITIRYITNLNLPCSFPTKTFIFCHS